MVGQISETIVQMVIQAPKLLYLLIKVYFLKRIVSHLNFKMAAIFQDGRHWRCKNTTFRHKTGLNEPILMMLESKCMFLTLEKLHPLLQSIKLIQNLFIL